MYMNTGLRTKRFRATSSMKMERERKRGIHKIRSITRSETLATQATGTQLRQHHTMLALR